MAVLGWMTQQQQEFTGVVAAISIGGLGLLMLITGRGSGELPIGRRTIRVTPRAIRIIGVSGALVGICLGISSFVFSAGPPPPGISGSDPWGGTAEKVFLGILVVWAAAITAYEVRRMFKK